MTTITFYEKPGCLNGEKQKAILQRAGNVLHCINILTHPWKREELRLFVAGKTPPTMMNGTAPAIKKGEIDPAQLSFELALALMLQEPILIKRPLLIVDGQFIQGFDDQRLRPYLGSWNNQEDVITCPNLQTLSCDMQH